MVPTMTHAITLLLTLATAPLTFDQLPAPVRAAVHTKYPDAKVLGVEKEKNDYEIKMTVDGAGTELTVAFDGTVLAEERVVAFKSMPAQLQKAFADSPEKTLAVERVEEVTEKGEKTYEIAGKRADGKRVEVIITAKGQLTVKPATE